MIDIDALLDRWTDVRLVAGPRPSSKTVDALALSTHLARWRLRAKAAWLECPRPGAHPTLVAESDDWFSALTCADPAAGQVQAARVFWIHLYNALVARLVLSYGRSFDLYRRHAVVVAGLPFTADAIEHGVLRENRGHRLLPGPAFASGDPRRRWVLELDPRVHAALHCGQESCPPVQIYTPASVEQDLDEALHALLASSTHLDLARAHCAIHPILYDYRRDFGSDARLLKLAVDATGEDVDCRHLQLTRRRPRTATAL